MPSSAITASASGRTRLGRVPALNTSIRSPAIRRNKPSAIWLRAEFPVHRINVLFLSITFLSTLQSNGTPRTAREDGCGYHQPRQLPRIPGGVRSQQRMRRRATASNSSFRDDPHSTASAPRPPALRTDRHATPDSQRRSASTRLSTVLPKFRNSRTAHRIRRPHPPPCVPAADDIQCGLTRRCFLSALAVANANAPVTLLDDGGWCWFEDERALIVGNNLIFGTVATGYRDPQLAGHIRATQFNLDTRQSVTTTLHSPASDPNPKQWIDDHNSPAFLHRPDGKILTMYARHGTANQLHYRVSTRKDSAAAWRPEKIFVPSQASRLTYSNLFYLSQEKRVYDLFRGYDDSYKPSYAFSGDLGETWSPGNVFINVPLQFRHRPYAKYCSNNTDTIHIAYTEGHPRSFDNSVYHIFYRNGQLHQSNGTPIRALTEGLHSADEGTRIFQGAPGAVAWTTDFHLINGNQLLLIYTTQQDGAGKPDRHAGFDHRFRLAHWDGSQWNDHEIARAGTRLYPGEDDYTGLAALDPHDPQTLFISTNVSPITGAALPHREIFRGRTNNYATFTWTPVTANSPADNVRPIVPIWPGRRRALLWLYGHMRTYTDYSFQVQGLFENR